MMKFITPEIQEVQISTRGGNSCGSGGGSKNTCSVGL